MLKLWQVGLLVLLGVALWAFVTLSIRSHPEMAADQGRAIRGFVTAPVGGFVSVWLCKLVGRLAPEQILPGVVMVGAVAMLLDGAALRWFASLYRQDEHGLWLTGANLLWGYGFGLAAALAWRWIALARRPAA